MVGINSRAVAAVLALILNTAAVCGSSDSTSLYSNFTNKPSISAGNRNYCLCDIIIFTDRIVWYDEILSVVGPTMIYTIDEETHATLGTSLLQTNTTSKFWGSDAASRLGVAWLGPVRVATLNTETDPLVTLTHTNIFSLIAVGLFTETVQTRSGTEITECDSRYGRDPSPPSLPSRYTYLYTSVFSFTHSISSCCQTNAPGGTIGRSQYISEIESLVHISSCADRGSGGAGELKIGVTILTATSNIYARAQITAPPSSSTPVVTAFPQTPANAAPAPGIPSPPMTTVAATHEIEPGSPPPLSGTNIPLPNEPTAGPKVMTLGTSTPTVLFLPSGSGYVLDGTTIQVGGPAVIVGGMEITANTNGLQTMPLQSSISGSGYIIDGTTLHIGGPAATLNGVIVTVNANGLQTISSISALAGTTEVPIPTAGSFMTIGGGSYAVSSIPGHSGIAIASQTLTPGGSVIADGYTVSWAVGASSLAIAGQGARSASTRSALSSSESGGVAKTTSPFGIDEVTSSRSAEGAMSNAVTSSVGQAQVSAGTTKKGFCERYLLMFMGLWLFLFC